MPVGVIVMMETPTYSHRLIGPLHERNLTLLFRNFLIKFIALKIIRDSPSTLRQNELVLKNLRSSYITSAPSIVSDIHKNYVHSSTYSVKK